MRKADIANEIYKQVGISKNEAADIVELVLNMLKAVLHKGHGRAGTLGLAKK
jgi:integration host factor subunit alpha